MAIREVGFSTEEIEVNGVTCEKIKFIPDVTRDGAYIDDKLVFDEYTFNQSIIDTSPYEKYPQSRTFDFVIVNEKKIHHDERDRDDLRFYNEAWSKSPYPFGYVESWEVTADGMVITCIVKPTYYDGSKQAIDLLKARMIPIIPIVKSNQLISIGLALDTPTGVRSWS